MTWSTYETYGDFHRWSQRAWAALKMRGRTLLLCRWCKAAWCGRDCEDAWQAGGVQERDDRRAGRERTRGPPTSQLIA